MTLIHEAVKKGCRKKNTCFHLGVEYRTICNWEREGLLDKRKGAKKRVANKLSEHEIKKIIKMLGSKKFRDLTPYEIVPILAERGIFLGSVSSFYRILKKENMLKHRSRSKKPGKNTSIELVATGPGQLLSWDITYLRTKIKGCFYYLYLVIDVWSRVILGWEIHTEENSEHAKALFEKICREWNICDATLHSDNGPVMRSATLHATLQLLGVVQSFSRPSVSNDNAFSESLFKTLKYTAGYPQAFNSIEEAYEWMEKFVVWYNTEHRHSGIGYVTPMQRHTGEDVAIFARRNKTYEEARAKHPERFSKKPKELIKISDVYLKKGNKEKRA